MIGMCGAYCGTCEWKSQMNCPGCLTAKGDMFWGACGVAKCVIAKGILHCGFCSELPCELLLQYCDNPEHGDNGERLANLRAWARGENSYLELTPKRKDEEQL